MISELRETVINLKESEKELRGKVSKLERDKRANQEEDKKKAL
jgi:hypothetical protein